MHEASTPIEPKTSARRGDDHLTSATPGATSVDELQRSELVRRDLVRWGPVLAGLVTVIATLAILSTLGLAIGLSAVEPTGDGMSAISTGAWIWGIASAVIAFFLGGMVAAMSSAVGGADRGLLNGLMVGAASIAGTLLLIGFGAGALLGAGASALGEVINVGNQLNFGQQADAATNAFARAEGSAWGSFIGLSLAVILAGLGGLVGARKRARNEPERH
jgi:hypothetical protein